MRGADPHGASAAACPRRRRRLPPLRRQQQQVSQQGLITCLPGAASVERHYWAPPAVHAGSSMPQQQPALARQQELQLHCSVSIAITVHGPRTQHSSDALAPLLPAGAAAVLGPALTTYRLQLPEALAPLVQQQLEAAGAAVRRSTKAVASAAVAGKAAAVQQQRRRQAAAAAAAAVSDGHGDAQPPPVLFVGAASSHAACGKAAAMLLRNGSPAAMLSAMGVQAVGNAMMAAAHVAYHLAGEGLAVVVVPAAARVPGTASNAAGGGSLACIQLVLAVG